VNEQPASEMLQQDTRYVYFISPAKPPPGAATPHAFLDTLYPRRKEEVQQNWKKVINQSVELVSQNVDSAPEGYQMDQIEVSLGFSATGQLAFIAQAGLEASVKVVFKRQQ
jgi:hypothetical protein